MKLSLVIPAKSKDDPKLAELLRSIEAQDFPKEEMEVLVITEGTSESAKAIGIRQAKGEVIGILASDNELIHKTHLKQAYELSMNNGWFNSLEYWYTESDDALNRYFSLIGGNDPLSFYMKKNDKSSITWFNANSRGTIGDNGFFIKKSLIEKTDLDNYYHIDNAIEATEGIPARHMSMHVWHKTGGNIFSFFRKRYRYGLQHAFNPNRRWHLVDFRQPKDIVRLIWFIIITLTGIQPILLSIRGYLKIKDLAWFMHWIVCLMTFFTYTLLMTHLVLRKLFQSLFAPTVAPSR